MTRPHCLNVGACTAKTKGKHCPSCACKSPEQRANRCAAAQRVLADPVKLARKQAAARAVSSNPEIIAQRSEMTKRMMADPKIKARHSAGCARGAARRMEDPEQRAILVNLGKTIGRINLQAGQSAETRKKVRAHYLAWCPEEQWDFNRTLKRKGIPLEERKAIILADVPGTAENARRLIFNEQVRMQIRHERQKAQEY